MLHINVIPCLWPIQTKGQDEVSRTAGSCQVQPVGEASSNIADWSKQKQSHYKIVKYH